MYAMKHKVKLSDTDVTGQVYYARPLEWMEWCRVEWFGSQVGDFMKYVEETGITYFPSKVNTEYKRPIFFGDELSIEMHPKEIKKVSFVFEYNIKRNEEVVLKSDITMVCFDTKKKSFGKISEDLMGKLNKI